jgi:DNA-binding transcriptional MerR regulator
MYKIGDFSRLAQIPIKTLRHYDGLGLLRPARVERVTGYRYYEAAQIEQLNRVLALKDLGFSLREIRDLIAENVPQTQMRTMLEGKVRALEEHVGRERARLARAAARLDALERGLPAAACEVAVRTVGARLVASVRDVVARHDESERLFDELDHHLPGRRAHGQRGAIWHACAEGAVDCEAVVFLPSRVDGTSRVRVREIPGQRVASLVYRGDGDFMPAYHAIRAWIAAGAAEIAGPKCEIYLEDGGRDQESVTEIQFPIAAVPETIH